MLNSSTTSFIKEKRNWFHRCVWQHLRYRRIIWGLLMLAFWLAIVPPVFIAYLREGGRSDTPLNILADETPDYISLTVIVQQADLPGHQLALYVAATPMGRFNTARKELATNLTGNFGFKTVQYAAGSLMPSNTLTIPALGSPRLYPFDEYTSALRIGFTFTDGGKAPVPIRVNMYGSVQTLDFDIDVTLAPDLPQTLDIVIATGRTKTTLFFALFISIISWALSLTLLILAFQVVVSRRDIPAPLLVLGITLLFSLPALRSSQPGIPALGCASDMLAYFWNLFIVALSSVSIILTWVLRWKRRRHSVESPSGLDSAYPSYPGSPAKPMYPTYGSPYPPSRVGSPFDRYPPNASSCTIAVNR
ncbi:hypothetical protein IWQ60_005721 [Tieghemiomyces parasiticus]|uniref:DUF4436 domain-containing protein n=1 Tax=Tieghemiomyces parasiticus TaxID=78921 RepID=A0A9W8A8M3_9FUNG|nr:hypothetical protein IWQ60_005721 [Tieghemiomyces parasiticus]